jgi:hypothetical protein
MFEHYGLSEREISRGLVLAGNRQCSFHHSRVVSQGSSGPSASPPAGTSHTCLLPDGI